MNRGCLIITEPVREIAKAMGLSAESTAGWLGEYNLKEGWETVKKLMDNPNKTEFIEEFHDFIKKASKELIAPNKASVEFTTFSTQSIESVEAYLRTKSYYGFTSNEILDIYNAIKERDSKAIDDVLGELLNTIIKTEFNNGYRQINIVGPSITKLSGKLSQSKVDVIAKYLVAGLMQKIGEYNANKLEEGSKNFIDLNTLKFVVSGNSGIAEGLAKGFITLNVPARVINTSSYSYNDPVLGTVHDKTNNLLRFSREMQEVNNNLVIVGSENIGYYNPKDLKNTEGSVMIVPSYSIKNLDSKSSSDKGKMSFMIPMNLTKLIKEAIQVLDSKKGGDKKALFVSGAYRYYLTKQDNGDNTYKFVINKAEFDDEGNIKEGTIEEVEYSKHGENDYYLSYNAILDMIKSIASQVQEFVNNNPSGNGIKDLFFNIEYDKVIAYDSNDNPINTHDFIRDLKEAIVNQNTFNGTDWKIKLPISRYNKYQIPEAKSKEAIKGKYVGTPTVAKGSSSDSYYSSVSNKNRTLYKNGYANIFVSLLDHVTGRYKRDVEATLKQVSNTLNGLSKRLVELKNKNNNLTEAEKDEEKELKKQLSKLHKGTFGLYKKAERLNNYDSVQHWALDVASDTILKEVNSTIEKLISVSLTIFDQEIVKKRANEDGSITNYIFSSEDSEGYREWVLNEYYDLIADFVEPMILNHGFKGVRKQDNVVEFLINPNNENLLKYVEASLMNRFAIGMALSKYRDNIVRDANSVISDLTGLEIQMDRTVLNSSDEEIQNENDAEVEQDNREDAPKEGWQINDVSTSAFDKATPRLKVALAQIEDKRLIRSGGNLTLVPKKSVFGGVERLGAKKAFGLLLNRMPEYLDVDTFDKILNIMSKDVGKYPWFRAFYSRLENDPNLKSALFYALSLNSVRMLAQNKNGDIIPINEKPSRIKYLKDWGEAITSIQDLKSAQNKLNELLKYSNTPKTVKDAKEALGELGIVLDDSVYPKDDNAEIPHHLKQFILKLRDHLNVIMYNLKGREKDDKEENYRIKSVSSQHLKSAFAAIEGFLSPEYVESSIKVNGKSIYSRVKPSYIGTLISKLNRGAVTVAEQKAYLESFLDEGWIGFKNENGAVFYNPILDTIYKYLTEKFKDPEDSQAILPKGWLELNLYTLHSNVNKEEYSDWSKEERLALHFQTYKSNKDIAKVALFNYADLSTQDFLAVDKKAKVKIKDGKVEADSKYKESLKGLIIAEINRINLVKELKESKANGSLLESEYNKADLENFLDKGDKFVMFEMLNDYVATNTDGSEFKLIDEVSDKLEIINKYLDGIVDYVIDNVLESNSQAISQAIQNEWNRTEFYNFLLDSYLYSLGMDQLLLVDPAFYPNFIQKQKRAKEVKSPGHHLYDKAQQRVLIVKSPKRASNTIDTVKKVFESLNNISEPVKKSIIADLEKIDTSDGQSWRSLASYIRVLEAKGNLNSYMRGLLAKYKNEKTRNELTMTERLLIFQSIKQFTYGTRIVSVGSKKIRVPYQFKNSESPILALMELLMPDMISDEYKNLLKFMKENNVDVVHYTSVVKVGGTKHALSLKDFSNNKASEFVVQNPDTIMFDVDSEFYTIQMETPPHLVDTTMGMGIQMKKLIAADLNLDGMYDVRQSDGSVKSMSGKELRDRFYELMSKYYSLSLKKAKGEFSDVVSLSKFLRREIRKNMDRYGISLYEAVDITYDKDGTPRFNKSLNSPEIRDKIESLLISYHRKKVVDHKIKGGTAIIVSDDFIPEGQKPKIIYEQDKDGNYRIKEVEVYLPAYTKKFYNGRLMEGMNVDISKFDESALRGIGYRVPTEYKYSMVNFKIKGFLPKESGTSIMLPSDYVILSGWDFDIDKLYSMFPEIVIYESKNNKGETELRVRAFNEKDVRQNSGDSNRIKDEIKLINNEILNVMDAVLSSPHTIDQILNPGGFKNIKKLGNYHFTLNHYRNKRNEIIKKLQDKELTEDERNGLEELKRKYEEDIQNLNNAYREDKHDEIDDMFYSAVGNGTNPYSVDYLLDTIERNQIGKQLVAIFANINSFHGMIQPYNLTFDTNIIKLSINGHKATGLGNITTVRGNEVFYISKMIAEYLAAAVDNGKDPTIGYTGIDLENVNRAATFLLMGYTQDEVTMLFNHPIFQLLKEGKIPVNMLESIYDLVEGKNITDFNLTTDSVIDSYTYFEDYFAKLKSAIDNNEFNEVKGKENIAGKLKDLGFEISDPNMVKLFSNILKAYATTTQLSRTISSMSVNLKLDSLKNVTSNADVLRKYINIKKLYDQQEKANSQGATLAFPFINASIIPNPDTKVDIEKGLESSSNYIESSYLASIRSFIDLHKGFYAEFSPEFLNVLSKLDVTLSDEGLRRFINEFPTFLLSNFAPLYEGYDGISEAHNDFILNFPSALASHIVSNPELLKNSFIKGLRSRYENQIEVLGISDYINLETAQEGFNEIVDTIPELAKDIIRYIYFREGFSYRPSGLFRIITPSGMDLFNKDKSELTLSEKMEEFRKLSEGEVEVLLTSYVEQFKLNNYHISEYSDVVDSNTAKLLGIDFKSKTLTLPKGVSSKEFIYIPFMNAVYRRNQGNIRYSESVNYNKVDVYGGNSVSSYNRSGNVISIYSEGSVNNSLFTDALTLESNSLGIDDLLELKDDSLFSSFLKDFQSGLEEFKISEADKAKTDLCR